MSNVRNARVIDLAPIPLRQISDRWQRDTSNRRVWCVKAENKMDDDATRLTFSGMQTCAQVKDVASSIRSAIESGRPVKLDFDEATEIDASAIQTIIAAHKYAELKKVPLSVNAHEDTKLYGTLDSLGFIGAHSGAACIEENKWTSMTTAGEC